MGCGPFPDVMSAVPKNEVEIIWNHCQAWHGWAVCQLEQCSWQACSCMLEQTVHGLMNGHSWTTRLNSDVTATTMVVASSRGFACSNIHEQPCSTGRFNSVVTGSLSQQLCISLWYFYVQCTSDLSPDCVEIVESHLLLVHKEILVVSLTYYHQNQCTSNKLP